MSSRKEVLSQCFSLLVSHIGTLAHEKLLHLPLTTKSSSTSSPLSSEAISPELFLAALRCVCPLTNFESEADVKAQLAAEYLIPTETVSQGISREYAVRIFDSKLTDVSCIHRGDWMYYFGVSIDEDQLTQQPTEQELSNRARPIVSNSAQVLQSFLNTRLVQLRSMQHCLQDEALQRSTFVQTEERQRSEMMSACQRQKYAIGLRLRIEEERQASQRKWEVEETNRIIENERRHVSEQKLEHQSITRRIAASRTSSVALEHALQECLDQCLQGGQQLKVLKQWQETSMRLVTQELIDTVTQLRGAVQTRTIAYDSRLTNIETKLEDVGRFLMLASVTKHGRKRHCDILRSMGSTDVNSGNFAWLMDDNCSTEDVLSSDANAERHRYDPPTPEEEDEDVARWLLKDTSLFLADSCVNASPQSVMRRRVLARNDGDPPASSTSTPITDADRSLPSQVFSALLSLEDRPSTSLSTGITLPTFARFVSESGLAGVVPSVPLVFSEYASLGEKKFASPTRGSSAVPCDSTASVPSSTNKVMGIVGFTRFLQSTAVLHFPRHARVVAPEALLDKLSMERLRPWLVRHDARKGRLNLEGSLLGSTGINAAVTTHKASNTITCANASPPLSFSTLLEEAIGALCGAQSSLREFLRFFTHNVTLYAGGAPIVRAQPQQGLFAEGFIPPPVVWADGVSIAKLKSSLPTEVQRPAGSIIPRWGEECCEVSLFSIMETVAAECAVYFGEGTPHSSGEAGIEVSSLEGSLDAVCSWLKMRCDGLPPREELAVRIASIAARIVRDSCALLLSPSPISFCHSSSGVDDTKRSASSVPLSQWSLDDVSKAIWGVNCFHRSGQQYCIPAGVSLTTAEVGKMECGCVPALLLLAVLVVLPLELPGAPALSTMMEELCG